VVLHTDLIALEQARKAKIAANTTKATTVASIVKKPEPEPILTSVSKPSSANAVAPSAHTPSQIRMAALDNDIKKMKRDIAVLTAKLNGRNYTANLRRR
jgi:hypothetical protein